MAESAISLDDHIIVAIRRISQAVDTYSRFLFTEYGLTAPQLGTLRELQRCGEATPSQISARIHTSPATLAGVLKRLEQQKLVARRRHSGDRRSAIIQITQKGRNLATKAPSLLRDQFRAELDQLEVWERTQILATLQRVASMISAEEVEEHPFLGIDPASEEIANSPIVNTAGPRRKQRSKRHQSGR